MHTDDFIIIVYCYRLHLILKIQVSSDMEDITTERQKAPYVIVLGDHKDPEQAFLIKDGNVVSDIPVDDVRVYLLAAFYDFNICYPVGCYCFVVVLLKLEPCIVVTSSVETFLPDLFDSSIFQIVLFWLSLS